MGARSDLTLSIVLLLRVLGRGPVLWTVLAFVPGKKAEDYEFTSFPCVQIFKELEPAKLSSLWKGKKSIKVD